MIYGFARRTPGTARGTVRARQDYSVTVRIAQPAFPMVRAAVAGWRIAVPGTESSRFAFPRRAPRPRRNRQAQTTEHAIAVRQILVTDWTVIVSHIPAVQLQDQSIVQNKTLILGAAMRTSTTKQTLIPATARFDIVHTNQRLWAHRN